MDEEIAIIDSKTRSEKIKIFFKENKKKLIIFLIFLLLVLITFFGLREYNEIKKERISDLYNSVIINYSQNQNGETTSELINIIKKKDPTYSPLSLYFIIDNKLISEKSQINELFDIIINQTSLKKEIKNLIIYKKGLYNADTSKENELLNILNPIVNSESIWKSHALYLLGEYFYSKNEKQKSKEFFNQILNLDNANQKLMNQAQKRINRDLSD